MKKLLITGSNGLLGQKLIGNCIHKRANQYQILATSQGENRITSFGGFNYKSMDITNLEDVQAVFDEFKPDIVINTAAMTMVDDCENQKDKCQKLNVEAVLNLINASRQHHSHFIHLSTDFIFDGEDGPYSEDAKPNPLSFYGESKLTAEKLIQESTISWAIARTVLVYGTAENLSRSNIVLWAKGALEKGEILKVVDDQFRSPTLAEDLAEGCLLMADKNAKGIYNISGKDQMSISELVHRVAKFFNLNESNIHHIKSATLNQAAKRPPITGFVLEKAFKDLNYQPHSFEEGLQILSNQLKA